MGAQRRPGRAPRRHSRANLCAQASAPLNEGRGAHPGDTASRASSACVAGTLNEGRGAHPGDTRRAAGVSSLRRASSTKAGARTPATRSLTLPIACSLSSLNEGRGAHPGDTRWPHLHAYHMRAAQRRPGRAPRRHAPRVRGGRSPGRRSTKAGARTPATRGATEAGLRRPRRSTKAGARTPATPLRRALGPDDRAALNEGRGAHPGDTSASSSRRSKSAIAQRRPGRAPRRHRSASRARMDRLRRSTKAGARTPATQVGRTACGRAPSPLNEGRGAHPGDTGAQPDHERPPRHRSTKAGARTPATHRLRHAGIIRPVRSTKAGARTPATPPGPARCRCSNRTLNEGRGAHPGDTRGLRVDRHGRHARSTKAGAHTPATPSPRATRPTSGGAQRRPGRTPRRHAPASARHADPPRPLNEGRGAHPGDTRHG